MLKHEFIWYKCAGIHIESATANRKEKTHKNDKKLPHKVWWKTRYIFIIQKNVFQLQ